MRIWLHLGLITITLLFANCRPEETAREHLNFPLAQPEVLQRLENVDRIHSIGIPVYLNAERMRQQFSPIAEHLSRVTGVPLEFKYAETYRQLIDSLAAGESQFAVLPPYAFVLADEEISDLRLLATQVAEGSTHFRGYIVANSESGIKTLQDLAGKPFAFVEENSTTGHVLAVHRLHSSGIIPDQFFSEIRWSGTHDKCLDWIIEGKVSAGAVYSGAIRAAAKRGVSASQFTILERTGLIPYDAWVASPKVDSQVSDVLQAALLQLSTATPEGRQVLGRGLAINGWVRGDRGGYDVLQEAHRLHRQNRESK